MLGHVRVAKGSSIAKVLIASICALGHLACRWGADVGPGTQTDASSQATGLQASLSPDLDPAEFRMLAASLTQVLPQEIPFRSPDEGVTPEASLSLAAFQFVDAGSSAPQAPLAAGRKIPRDGLSAEQKAHFEEQFDADSLGSAQFLSLNSASQSEYVSLSYSDLVSAPPHDAKGSVALSLDLGLRYGIGYIVVWRNGFVLRIPVPIVCHPATRRCLSINPYLYFVPPRPPLLVFGPWGGFGPQGGFQNPFVAQQVAALAAAQHAARDRYCCLLPDRTRVGVKTQKECNEKTAAQFAVLGVRERRAALGVYDLGQCTPKKPARPDPAHPGQLLAPEYPEVAEDWSVYPGPDCQLLCNPDKLDCCQTYRSFNPRYCNERRGCFPTQAECLSKLSVDLLSSLAGPRPEGMFLGDAGAETPSCPAPTVLPDSSPAPSPTASAMPSPTAAASRVPEATPTSASEDADATTPRPDPTPLLPDPTPTVAASSKVIFKATAKAEPELN